MPPGFLAVSSRPSSTLSLEEFHFWYEEEHIPLRLNHLPFFLSGARYQSIDGSETGPEWLALYEIDDTRAFGEESYTSLRSKRSERETSVMQRLEVLTRILGKQVLIRGSQLEDEQRTGLKTGNPSQGIISHLLDINGEDIDRDATHWADQTSTKASQILHGWIRMRVVRVLVSSKTEMGAAAELSPSERASHFVIHEFDDGDDDFMGRFLSVLSTNDKDIMQCRSWKLYKAYPCIAQGNVVAA